MEALGVDVLATVEFKFGADLLAALQSSRRVEINGWPLHLDEHGVWLTNPYGIDCGFVPATAEGCQIALDAIKNDTHEREWW